MVNQKVKNSELGLSRVQVENRRQAGLDNREVEASSKTVKQIIVSNVFTYFNLIFTIIDFGEIVSGFDIFADYLGKYIDWDSAGTQGETGFG